MLFFIVVLSVVEVKDVFGVRKEFCDLVECSGFCNGFNCWCFGWFIFRNGMIGDLKIVNGLDMCRFEFFFNVFR